MRAAVLACGALATLASLTFAVPTVGQDVLAEPTFATLTLRAGFRPDPQRVEVVSGGAVDAQTLGEGCVGHIATAPDVRVVYTSGDYPLIFHVTSSSDTTLVINAPNGSWHCNDDATDSVDPTYAFKNPQSGTYDVFIGNYENANADATLSISEEQ